MLFKLYQKCISLYHSIQFAHTFIRSFGKKYGKILFYIIKWMHTKNNSNKCPRIFQVRTLKIFICCFVVSSWVLIFSFISDFLFIYVKIWLAPEKSQNFSLHTRSCKIFENYPKEYIMYYLCVDIDEAVLLLTLCFQSYKSEKKQKKKKRLCRWIWWLTKVFLLNRG